jgi:hypothetical protein
MSIPTWVLNLCPRLWLVRQLAQGEERLRAFRELTRIPFREFRQRYSEQLQLTIKATEKPPAIGARAEVGQRGSGGRCMYASKAGKRGPVHVWR